MISPVKMTRRALATIGRLRRRSVVDLLYALIWRVGARFAAPSVVHRAVFTRIYDHNEWGNVESRSGPGSSRARGADISESLIDAFHTLSISTLLDAPCGDFNWMRNVTGCLDSYVGVDVVRDLIAHGREVPPGDQLRRHSPQ